MEKRGESLDLGVRCKGGEGEAAAPAGSLRVWGRRAGHGSPGTVGEGSSPKETGESQQLGKPPEFWFLHIQAPGLSRPPCKPVGCQQVATSPAFLRQAWSPEAESISPQPLPEPPVPSAVSCEPPAPFPTSTGQASGSWVVQTCAEAGACRGCLLAQVLLLAGQKVTGGQASLNSFQALLSWQESVPRVF
ncbi:putative uncharacterized protein KIRREL3-AS3 [Plecturocebus cupreus]